MKLLLDTNILVAAVTSRITATVSDSSDMMAANSLQSETLLYPMDALVPTAADSIDAPLVSFDAELLEHGAKHPSDLR